MTLEHSVTDDRTGARGANRVISHGAGLGGGHKPKLIEVALPLKDISETSAREKSIRHGHPSTLHLWWSRKPLAAARAVIWASLVDDPSGHPDQFPTEESQTLERERLFNILKRLVVWKTSNDPKVLADARAEIEASCGPDLPIMIDPFVGGGSVALESQRLGLPAYGSDLNPVAVLISKALVEIPPRFGGKPPINPKHRESSGLKTWNRAQGLADDIRYYGAWMREHAETRIGHLYPPVELPSDEGGKSASVIGWLWARTVRSPDPTWDGHVPLVHSWVIRNRSGKPKVWVEPLVDRDTHSISYSIREGEKPPAGTISRRGGTCIATGSAMPFGYIREQGRKQRMGVVQIAVVAEGNRKRVYLAPVRHPDVPLSKWSPSISLPERTLGFRVQKYGLTQWEDLFTDRQLLALSTFGESLRELRPLLEQHCKDAGLADDGVRFRDGGSGITAYADALATYLALAIDRCADKWSNLVIWNSARETVEHVFGRQALSMVWIFAEGNPFSSSGGNWLGQVEWIAKSVANAPARGFGSIQQRDAVMGLRDMPASVICTDPPYYDNVPYADISDFFYVWLRHNLTDIWPDQCSTLLTPKTEELVANPDRAGSKQAAKEHFENGMAAVLEQVAQIQREDFPATIFYAFKQQETKQGKTISTGWETFLQSLVDAGLCVTATWPIRTEMAARMRAKKSAALASSIVIACRPRVGNAPLETRGGLVSALRAELAKDIRLLQKQNIAPVDMAQSAIGPGMKVFSRYTRVVEADGSTMKVRAALSLINEVLGEVLSEEEAELDPESRFALTWFEQYGHNPGPFGDADVLARGKNTAVDSVVRAGIARSQGGQVTLLPRKELPQDWSPAKDKRRTDWEAVQHLILRLDWSQSEAAELMRQLGGLTDRVRPLAYLLYSVCDNKGWSEDAVAYNSLITAWPELTRLASKGTLTQEALL